MDGILGDMLKVILAGGVGYLVATVTERGKVKRARQESLRQAYSKWLAAQATLEHRLNTIVSVLDDVRTDSHPPTGPDRVVDAASDLDADIRSLLTVVQEAYLLETRPAFRRVLEKVTRSGTDLSRTVSHTVSHYQMHTGEVRRLTELLDQLDKQFDAQRERVKVDPEKLEGWKKDRARVDDLRKDLTEWGVSCELLNKKGLEDLRSLIANHRSYVDEMRSVIANQNV